MTKSMDNGFVKILTGFVLASIKIKALNDFNYRHDNNYHLSSVYHDLYDFVYGSDNSQLIITHEEFENLK